MVPRAWFEPTTLEMSPANPHFPLSQQGKQATKRDSRSAR